MVKKFNIDAMRTDVDLEINGVWEELGGGFKILIARIGNANYLAEIRRLALESTYEADDDIQQEAITGALGKAVVLDWKEMYREMTAAEIAEAKERNEELPSDRMVEVPYSAEKAIELLKEVPDFYRLVLRLAGSASRFRNDNIAKQAKG